MGGMVPRASSRLAVLLALLSGLVGVDTYQFGDQISGFKRTSMHGKVSVWSDILVGHCPIFGYDYMAGLDLFRLNGAKEVKLQLSFDDQKQTSEWFTVADGQGNKLHELNLKIFHANGAIHDVVYTKHYTKEEQTDWNGNLQDRIMISYTWVQDVETDTRMGLDFLFLAGFTVSMVSILSVWYESSTELMSSRAMVVPEYDDESSRKRPKVKRFVMHEAQEAGSEGGEKTIERDNAEVAEEGGFAAKQEDGKGKGD